MWVWLMLAEDPEWGREAAVHLPNPLLPQQMLAHSFPSHGRTLFTLITKHDRVKRQVQRGRGTGGHGHCRGGQGCGRAGEAMVRMDSSRGQRAGRLPSGFGLGDGQPNESSQARHAQGHAANDGHAYQSIWKGRGRQA